MRNQKTFARLIRSRAYVHCRQRPLLPPAPAAAVAADLRLFTGISADRSALISPRGGPIPITIPENSNPRHDNGESN